MTAVGLVLPQLGPVVDAQLIKDAAQSAEDMGFAHLWVQDHFIYALQQQGTYGGSAKQQPEVYKSVFAPLEILSAVAAWTSTIELGTSVLVAGNHWPVQLANRLSTVDQLSQGRLTAVGLGVGWSHEEHRAVGVNPKTRGRRIEEFLEVLKKAWETDPVEHHGTFFELPKSHVLPKPLRQPRLMSGMASEKGLQRTAQHYDLWNPGSIPISQVVETLEKMNAERPDHLEPLNAVYRVALQSTAGKRLSVDQVVERTIKAADAGLEAVIVETNFCSEITSASKWMDLIGSLSPIIQAAQSASTPARQ
jgi:probable F420-dependent oxidoreductase